MATFGSLRSVLDKMENDDPDFRYMAASDLLEHLRANGVRAADTETQRRLCRSIITLLTDSSSEVQGMAQRCLPPLSRFVEDRHAVFLVEKLLDHVLAVPDPSKETGAAHDAAAGAGLKSLRDVASLGLKSIINDLPTEVDVKGGHGPIAGTSMANHMLPRLLAAIDAAEAKGQADLQVEALELLHVLLARLAPLLAASHDAVRATVLPRLASPRRFVCKRATSCLGVLAPVCSAEIFDAIVQAIIAELRAAQTREKTRTAVHAVWALSKTSGQRLAGDLPVIVPILFELCTEPEFEEDDELREHCLQTLESFVDRCTREMAVHADTLAGLVVRLAKYDPNYAASDEDEDEGEDGRGDDSMQDGADAGEDGCYDHEEEDNFSDDDDSSWKVRRAAVKCIHAAVTSHLRPAGQLYTDFGLLLVGRFKEREETVKLDVFAAFRSMLRLAAAAVDSVEPYPFLTDGSPMIVRAVRKELQARSVKTRISAMAVLRELVILTPPTVAPLLVRVIPDVHKSLADPSAQMKTEALLLLHSVIAGCGPAVLRDHTRLLIPRILEAAGDRYYKITAESLRVCSAFVSAYGAAGAELRRSLGPLAPSIHDAALRRLTAQDQDSEVKEAGLECVGGTVALFGGDLGGERLSIVASILCDRLNNEVTRLPTVRALHRIAESEHAAVLAPVMEKMTAVVCGFLRKSNTPLRLASLTLLAAAPNFSADNDPTLLTNVADLVSEEDLRLAALALRMCARLTRTRGPPICGQLAAANGVFERVLDLAVSPMLQGRAVDAIMDMFKALAEVNAAPLTAEAMLARLRSSVVLSSPEAAAPRVTGTGSLNPVQCVAKCVAIVCQVAPPALWSSAAGEFVREVAAATGPVRTYALACLGELGRRSLLGGEGGDGKVQAQAAILAALDAGEEEVKGAAAVALGGVASGDGAAGIPALVDLVVRRPENRYLLLLSLRDAIAFSDAAAVANITSHLLTVLTEDVPPTDVANGAAVAAAAVAGTSADPKAPCEDATRLSGQESVQIAVAECLGLLAQVDPTVVLPELQQKISSKSIALRCSVVASVKFMVSPGPADLVPSPALGDSLRAHIGAFLALAGDEDVSVRRNAMQSINAVARSQPALLVPHLSALLPAVYAATVKDPDLVRQVDLGPFKFEEDFGMDLRKSAFDSMRTLISGSLAPLIPLPDFLDRVVDGLGDEADVRSIAQLVLATIAGLPSAPPALIAVLRNIVKALEGTLSRQLKDNAVRQEQDRHEESLNGALRAVRVLDNMPSVSSQPAFASFMSQTVRTAKMSERYDNLQGGSTVIGVSDGDAMQD
jgi:cullin-associated NEDD8-dissociated protein 1